MADTDRLARVAADPRYRELVSARSRFAWALTLIILVAYFGFILLVAFAKDWLAQPIGDGVTSVGLPVGVAVILLAIAATGVYVRRANREFDALTDALVREHDA